MDPKPDGVCLEMDRKKKVLLTEEENINICVLHNCVCVWVFSVRMHFILSEVQ